MKKVYRRALFLLPLIGLLVSGTLLFCLRYATQGDDWAAFSANEHAYTDGRLSVGQILDRNGIPLYDAETDEYAAERALRRATLHLVGDSDNNIGSSIKSALPSALVGFDVLSGTTGGGSKVYLTIDAELQMAAYEALDGRSGTVAVYNYQTGEVLCMVSTPTFDPQDPPTIKDGDSRYEGVYLNRCLSSTYTPGSVFKIITTAAALEQLKDVQQFVGGVGEKPLLLLPGPLHRSGDQTGEKIAADQQHHQCDDADDQRGAHQRAQGGLLQ